MHPPYRPGLGDNSVYEECSNACAVCRVVAAADTLGLKQQNHGLEANPL